jgi:hypothetical protein
VPSAAEAANSRSYLPVESARVQVLGAVVPTLYGGRGEKNEF